MPVSGDIVTTPPPKASTPDTPDFSPEAIAEALRKATPGPWVGIIKPNGKGTGLVGVKAKRGMGEQGCIAVINSIPGGKERVANTKLLGNAPTWLAQLLAALEAAEEAHAKVQRLQRAEYRLLKSKARKLAAAEAALEASERENERLTGALREIAYSPKTLPMGIRPLARAALTPSTPPDLREDAP